MPKRSTFSVLLAVVLLPLSAMFGVKATAAPQGPKLRLQIGAFDPAASSPTVKGVDIVGVDAPIQRTPGRPALWAIQATSADTQAHVATAVAASGAKVLGYVPDHAYAVYATPEQRIAFLNAVGPLVRFSGPFQPSWRLRPGLTDLTGANTVVVRFFHGLTAEQKAAGFAAVSAVSSLRVLQGQAGDEAVRVNVDAARLGAVAAVPEVEWVNTPGVFKLHNATARWVTDTGSREVLHLTKPGVLTGAGQVAAVADTGWNYLPDVKGDAQAYFADCSTPTTCKEADYTLVTPGLDDPTATQAHNTGHRKLVAYLDLGASGARPSDDSAHGTHTAGSVAGNIAPTASINEADGMAWASRLVHQNIADVDGGLGGIPADMADLFLGAYRPSDPESARAHSAANLADYDPLEDARTHNNSWGGDAVVFMDTATGLDQFVWDHEDMAVVVSAGNDGTGDTPGVVGTVGAPATAKNDLTSGASVNGDQPQASPESLAIFSSHGPTADGRYGPDLITPGQIVISAKGSTAQDEHYLQGTSMSAPVLTGLSTLVRQYFWDGYGPALAADAGAGGIAVGTPDAARRFNPSAALVKAVLVNGATRMRGWYTGDDGADRDQDGQYPSAGQGYGLVNLDNSLYLPNDPTSLWVKDVWRDTRNGAAAGSPEAFSGNTVMAQSQSYQLTVAAGAPLDVTLAWTDAPALIPNAAPSLINDLNLTVTAPDGTTVYRGNNFNTRATPKAADYQTPAGGSADTVNNTEKVRLAAPTAGTYTVIVTAPRINSIDDQGYSLAASGKISTASATPTLNTGWRTDATPGASPAVVSHNVDHSSNDTAVVTVNTNELTKAVLETSSGGVFRSVDTVGADGFPGLPSAFEPEIPDTTGFPPAANGHDVLSDRHRILVTGARTRNATMTVHLTDIEGRTASVFLGSLFEETGVYQAPLDDIAQFASDDPEYGGFDSKSTQMYIGRLVDADHLGAFKFAVPESYDTAKVGAAVVETASGHDFIRHDLVDWRLRTEVLDEAVEADWRANDYASIHEADPTLKLNPETGTAMGANATYVQAVACSNLSAFNANLDDGNVAVRMEADVNSADAAVSFETGANRRSRGPQHRPRLVLYQQQDNGTLLDPRPCDPNAPAPAISDVRVQQLPNNDNTTYNGVVSWRTDVPSDSTVLFRPRGAGAASWVEVGVPGRTTNHVVEVKGLLLNTDYEFVVNSASCNGQNTTDTNAGAGYAFVNRTGTPYTVTRFDDFEPSTDNWSAARVDPTPPITPLWAHETGESNSPTHNFNVAPYTDDGDTTLTSPTFNTAAGRLRIAWYQRLDTEPNFDYLRVEYNTGAGWTEINRFSGTSTHFESGGYDRQEVEAVVPAAQSVQVRFRFTSDEAVNSVDGGYDGVWVDDVTISQGGPALAPFAFPHKAASASSSVAAPAVPLRTSANAADRSAGTARCAPVTSTVYVPPPPPVPTGYWMTASDAGLFNYGDAPFVGSRGGQLLNQPVVGMAVNRANNQGYWQVAADGGIFTYGQANFYGSMGGTPLNKPVVGMTALPDGSGYWLVASDGGIFSFGNARFHGSTGSIQLNKPIVGMAATPGGGGYWLVASDGGIFAFGDAVTKFYGSLGGTAVSAPIVGMEPTPAGDGYYMVGQDGAVYAFGAAKNVGSMAGRGITDVVGIAITAAGDGYWLAGSNGAVYAFGKAKLLGSASNLKLFRPIVGIEGF